MTRIAMVPWVRGTRSGCRWSDAGYTRDHVLICVRNIRRCAPDLPIVVVTPHTDERFDEVADVTVMDGRGSGCAIMANYFDERFDEFDIDCITTDTLVLRDPRHVMPSGSWTAPRQHLPAPRHWSDWFFHVPARHPIRKAVRKALRGVGDAALDRFDRFLCKAVGKAKPDVILEPPTIMTGEWVLRDWEPWCQHLMDVTAAVHSDGAVKWPELASSHSYFHHLEPLVKP